MTIPLPTIPGVFRVTLNWGSFQQTANNVMHIGQPVGGTATVSDVHSALLAHVTAGMWSSVATSAFVTGLEVIPLDGSSSTTTFPAPTPATNWTGSSTGDGIPQVAALVSLSTGFRGRNRRGRMYLPFTGENDASAGILQSPFPANMSAAWNTFVAAMLANTPVFSLGVASYDRAHNGAGASFFPAGNVVVRSVLATQRRRQDRLR